MKSQSYLNMLLAIPVLSLFLIGCPQIGFFSKTQHFTGSDTMELKSPRADFLEVVAEVGKSMNYDISSLDKNLGVITLSSEHSRFASIGYGAIDSTTLRVFSINGGKTLDIRIMVIGNFGAGGQEAADKAMSDFKSRLTQRLGQK